MNISLTKLMYHTSNDYSKTYVKPPLKNIQNKDYIDKW